MITVTSYMNGEEVKSVLPRTNKGLLAMYDDIVAMLCNAGYMKIQMGDGAFLTDGDSSYKIQMA